MATGRITSLRADKGFGFISDSTGQRNSNDLFFHHSAVEGSPFDELAEGQEVSYTVEPDPRDPSRFRATNVRLVASGGGTGDGA
jgi:CspA family cold shock protein